MVFCVCEGSFGYLGGGGVGGCALCLLNLVSMWWFCILYAFLRVFGKICIGQLFRHGL